jgi:hypothetical protein
MSREYGVLPLGMWVANMHKAYNNNKRKVIQGMGSGGPFSTICKKGVYYSIRVG